MGNNNHRKLRAIAIREIRLANPSSVNAKKASAALSSLSRTLKDVDELQNQADLLHVEAVLVSEGMNDNGDAFTHAELKRAISTPILKPMNWQHKDDRILGAMYAVEARDLNGNPVNIDEIKDQPIELVIQGAVWHHLPHIQATATEIVQRINRGDLFVSMECWFDDYEFGFFTEAGELYDIVPRNSDTAFLEGHLRANGGTGKFNNMRIGRALCGINFGGCAFVDRPANKRSHILNHFIFDPAKELSVVEADRGNQDQEMVATKTTLFTDQLTEVNMNDLNRAAASEDIAKGVEQALEARDRVEAAKRTQADLQNATARNAELESELAKAQDALQRLQAAIDSAYAGATSNTPEEIARIDRSLDVKGDGAGEAVHAAKIAWIADSRRAVAEALVKANVDATDTKLVEENTALKAELTKIKNSIREAEIKHLFATVLKLEDDEVQRFVKAGLSKETDEAYAEWLEEKMVFARKILETSAATETEAGLLEPSQRETPIEDHGATLRSELGTVPADATRTPRSKLTAAADLDTLFEEVDEPDLAGAKPEGQRGTAMAGLVSSLLDSDKKDN